MVRPYFDNVKDSRIMPYFTLKKNPPKQQKKLERA